MMRNIWRLAGILLLLPILLLPAEAGEYGKSIRICLNVGELPVTNGAFTLYRVGTPISDGYRIEEDYGGGFVRDEDALSPHLAQWMNSMEAKRGQCVLLDVDGNAVFTDLENGLYLLKQTEKTDGFYPIQPFLVSVSDEKDNEILLYLEPLPMVSEAPPTGQDPAPFIGLVGMLLSLAGLAFCTGGRKRW